MLFIVNWYKHPIAYGGILADERRGVNRNFRAAAEKHSTIVKIFLKNLLTNVEFLGFGDGGVING